MPVHACRHNFLKVILLFIYIWNFFSGGEHVAVGYYKQPEKTREEFVEVDGKRWFKTGDIGLYDSEGALKIIGENFYLSIVALNFT